MSASDRSVFYYYRPWLTRRRRRIVENGVGGSGVWEVGSGNYEL
ncbi:hypothetical protein [Microcystis aeruginosa]|nr:hypothetical protein [Microcystis aeruginosa]